MYFNSYLVFVLLNRFYEGVICCHEDSTRLFGTCTMKCVKRVQTVPVIFPCPGFNFVINLYTALCKLKDALHILPSFFIRYLKNLRFDNFATNQFTIRYTPLEDFSNCLSFDADTMNGLVVKWPAQAADVEIYFYSYHLV